MNVRRTLPSYIAVVNINWMNFAMMWCFRVHISRNSIFEIEIAIQSSRMSCHFLEDKTFDIVSNLRVSMPPRPISCTRIYIYIYYRLSNIIGIYLKSAYSFVSRYLYIKLSFSIQAIEDWIDYWNVTRWSSIIIDWTMQIENTRETAIMCISCTITLL